MSEPSVEALLAQSPIFRLLDDEGRARIAAVALEVVFPPGAVVLREGEEGEVFYVNLSGTLSVHTDRADETKDHIATLEDGAIFGEIATLTREPRTATVTAVTEVRALELEFVGVFNVLKDYPDALAELKRLGVARSEDLIQHMIED